MSTRPFNPLSQRFRSWGLLSLTSAVCLGAVVSGTEFPRENAAEYVIAVCSISLIMSFMYAGMAMYWSSTGQKDYLAKAEPCVSGFLFLLWAIALGIIGTLNTATFGDGDTLYIVVNANGYYFSWASFFLVVVILGNSLKDLRFKEMSGDSPRTTKWIVVLASGIVVLGGSSSAYRAADCNLTISNFCRSSKIGITMGTICCLMNMIVLGLYIHSKGEKDQYLQIETIVAVTSTIFYAACVATITAPEGPGAFIGNLYYATWISFVTYINLCMDCFSVANVGMIRLQIGEPSKREKQDEGKEEGNPKDIAPHVVVDIEPAKAEMETELEEQAPDR